MTAFNEAWMLSTFFTWLRLSAFLAFSPLATAAKVPKSFLVFLALALAGLLVGALEPRNSLPVSLPAFVFGALGELGIGALLAFALQCAFAAFALTGKLLDVQMGFGLAAIYDPVTQSNAPVVGAVMTLLGMALFFALDGHHAMVRAIAFSLSTLPPGHLQPSVSVGAVVRPFGAMFTIGASLAAPVLLMLFLADVALGFAARVLPQMNVFFVGIPAKILIGWGALSLTGTVIGAAMAQAFSAVFQFWSEVLQ